MVSVDARTVEEDGITLVAATLSGGAVPTRVAVDNRLDGPVWPPRRMGKPEAGWDEDGYEGVVPADGEIAIGYACPAPAADPPLEIVTTERVEEGDDSKEKFQDADDVLRGLGTPAPPREAVPITLPEDDSEDTLEKVPHESAVEATVAEERHTASEGQDDDGAAGEGETAKDEPEDDTPDRSDGRPVPDPRSSPTTAAPEPVTAWLDVVEDRIERAESLAGAEGVPAATDALEAVGSLEDARHLEEQREADAAHLREVATRANALAYRAEQASIAVDALDRLA